MTFSLINIVESSGPLISGYWIQNHVGTLASAIVAALATEDANSHKITVAVVAELSSMTPALSFYTNLTRLVIDSLVISAQSFIAISAIPASILYCLSF